MKKFLAFAIFSAGVAALSSPVFAKTQVEPNDLYQAISKNNRQVSLLSSRDANLYRESVVSLLSSRDANLFSAIRKDEPMSVLKTRHETAALSSKDGSHTGGNTAFLVKSPTDRLPEPFGRRVYQELAQGVRVWGGDA